MPREIIDDNEVTLPQVKKILKKREKQGELSFQQTITLEHATTFAKMTPSASKRLVKRLMKNYELTRFQAVQIVNIGPTTPEELKTLIDLRSTSLTDEQLEEIAEIMESKVR